MSTGGDKAKGRISKRVFQENRARQIFRKTNISYPLIRGKKCLFFQKIWHALFFTNAWCPRKGHTYLNKPVKMLHQKRFFDMSLFRIIVRSETLFDLS